MKVEALVPLKVTKSGGRSQNETKIFAVISYASSLELIKKEK